MYTNMTTTATTATTTTTASATPESILESCRKMQAMMDAIPKPDVDVFVMTYEQFSALRKAIDPRDELQSFRNVDAFDRLAGIPIERYASKTECLFRANELVDEGKRVGLVT